MDSYLSSSNLNNFPLVTVAVITRNRADSLKRTLHAIKQLDYPNYEVLVVDNASTDHTKEVIAQSGFQYLYSSKNNGFAKTRQIAVNAAKGEFICWCDDDCVPVKNWISEFLNYFNKHEQTALLSGKVINVNFTKFLKNKGKEIFSKNGYIERVSNPYEAYLFANLNMAICKKKLNEIGGYDAFFVGGYEEIDLNLTFRQFGYEVAYIDSAVIYHYHNRVSFKKGRLLFGPQLMRLYLVFKHKNLSIINFSCFFELKMMIKELKSCIKFFISGILNYNYAKINVGLIEGFNAISSRLFIPFIWIKTYKWRQIFAKKQK